MLIKYGAIYTYCVVIIFQCQYFKQYNYVSHYCYFSWVFFLSLHWPKQSCTIPRFALQGTLAHADMGAVVRARAVVKARPADSGVDPRGQSTPGVSGQPVGAGGFHPLGPLKSRTLAHRAPLVTKRSSRFPLMFGLVFNIADVVEGALVNART